MYVMSERKQKIVSFFALGALLLVLGFPMSVFAAQSSSSNYQVNEVFFGSGGELNACSTTFCSKQSAGELVVGNTKSTNYQAQGGFNTERTPYIEVQVGNSTVDLGDVDSTTTHTGTATFSVKSYLSHGYSVVSASDPPKNNSYTIQTSTIPGASTTGTEQFGMNLVDNSSPNIGADPVQDPDNSFSFGLVAIDYSSPNLFKYEKGDIIAYSTSSTSFTNYTISYIINVSKVTPGGTYLMNHVLVATGTY